MGMDNILFFDGIDYLTEEEFNERINDISFYQGIELALYDGGFLTLFSNKNTSEFYSILKFSKDKKLILRDKNNSLSGLLQNTSLRYRQIFNSSIGKKKKINYEIINKNNNANINRFDKIKDLNTPCLDKKPLEFWLFNMGFMQVSFNNKKIFEFDIFQYSALNKKNQINFQKYLRNKKFCFFSENYNSFFNGIKNIDKSLFNVPNLNKTDWEKETFLKYNQFLILETYKNYNIKK